MAEKKDDVQVQPVDGVSEQEIDYAAELKKLQEAQSEYDLRFDEIKKTLSKRDSTISRLSKEKETLELEKLSESERAEAEKAKAIEERESIKAETERLRVERDLAVVLSEAKLDPDTYGQYVREGTIDEMRESVKGLSAVINATVEQRLDEALKSKHKPGDIRKPAEPGTIDDQIKEARSSGDTARALRLQLEKSKKQSE